MQNFPKMFAFFSTNGMRKKSKIPENFAKKRNFRKTISPFRWKPYSLTGIKYTPAGMKYYPAGIKYFPGGIKYSPGGIKYSLGEIKYSLA